LGKVLLGPFFSFRMGSRYPPFFLFPFFPPRAHGPSCLGDLFLMFCSPCKRAGVRDYGRHLGGRALGRYMIFFFRYLYLSGDRTPPTCFLPFPTPGRPMSLLLTLSVSPLPSGSGPPFCQPARFRGVLFFFFPKHWHLLRGRPPPPYTRFSLSPTRNPFPVLESGGRDSYQIWWRDLVINIFRSYSQGL